MFEHELECVVYELNEGNEIVDIEIGTIARVMRAIALFPIVAVFINAPTKYLENDLPKHAVWGSADTSATVNFDSEFNFGQMNDCDKNGVIIYLIDLVELLKPAEIEIKTME